MLQSSLFQFHGHEELSELKRQIQHSLPGVFTPNTFLIVRDYLFWKKKIKFLDLHIFGVVSHVYAFIYTRSPLSRRFHLPYLPSGSTLSHIFSFLEAPPIGFFMGVYILANHKGAVVLYCLCHMQAGQKYFNNSEKCRKFTTFFRVLCEHQRVFAEN